MEGRTLVAVIGVAITLLVNAITITYSYAVLGTTVSVIVKQVDKLSADGETTGNVLGDIQITLSRIDERLRYVGDVRQRDAADFVRPHVVKRRPRAVVP